MEKGNWSVNNKGMLFKCKYNCDKNHEHYYGTYEGALKYFGVNHNDPKYKGDLMNVIIYHQFDPKTITKTSNELYYIIIKAMSTKKYWVDENNRHKESMDLLEKCKEKHLIFDDEIFENINTENKRKRKYRYDQWLKMIDNTL